MKKLDINLGDRSYPIFIENNYNNFETYLSQMQLLGRIVVITDTNVDKYQWDNFINATGLKVDKIVIEAGEESKNIDTVVGIYRSLMEMKVDRNTSLIAFGGGVVGDITGFIAATYLRGLNFIQVPTTLLAQSDSSVGGKVGIDFDGAKNMVGAFYQPKLVYINVEAIKTLPLREIRTGLAEVVKHGVIADIHFFEYLEENLESILNFDNNTLQHMVKVNCMIKGHVVENDEREHGLRAHLNFGHTLGHAIETVSNFKYSHGESVSVGMIGAFKLANKLGLSEIEDTNRLERLLEKIGLPIFVTDIDRDAVFKQLFFDKKVLNNNLVFILSEKIGQVNKYTISDEIIIKNTISDIVI